jgi:hypothetical protein
MAKIIQIAIGSGDDGAAHTVYALDANGDVWAFYDHDMPGQPPSVWGKLPSLPAKDHSKP